MYVTDFKGDFIVDVILEGVVRGGKNKEKRIYVMCSSIFKDVNIHLIG